MKKKINLKDS